MPMDFNVNVKVRTTGADKIDALEKRIAQLEDKNNDEFNMRRVL